jgi:tRNA (guanine37-N1)-methyltransferase
MDAPALRVPASEGERLRRELADADLLRTDLAIGQDGDHLLLPLVTGDPDRDLPYPVVEADLEVRETGPDSYRDLLDLPADLQEELPSSFDRIGDVVVVKIPEPLEDHTEAIAEALLEATAPARTVAVDRGVKGPYRVRDLEVVDGDPETETTHIEHGVELRVDPATVYFSPRLATERHRVAQLVEAGEVVVDLFAGVGPFTYQIVRHGDPERVVAADVNPAAVRYLEENRNRNDAGDVVEVREGDAEDVGPAVEGADRVITNLPHGAEAYLEAALAAADPPAVLHYHAILEPETLEGHLDELRERAEAKGYALTERRRRRVRQYSQWEDHVAVDLDVRHL